MEADNSDAVEGADGGDPTGGYFTSYGQLGVHELMLKDEARTRAYADAFARFGDALVRGKVVMDVGAGTGILSLFAARAGARCVYAVEASNMAHWTRQLVQANGYADVVQVLQQRVEDVELPEKVDVIVSEWMGHYLWHEAMFESVIVARDKWLAPGGVLFPNVATLTACPVSLDTFVKEKITFWDNVYGFDFSVLKPLALLAASREPQLPHLERTQLLAEPQRLASFDLATLGEDDLSSLTYVKQFTFSASGGFRGIALWFDVSFAFNDDCVTLDTSPFAPPTHWKQTVIVLPRTFPIDQGEELRVRIRMEHDAHRAYALSLDFPSDDECVDEDVGV